MSRKAYAVRISKKDANSKLLLSRNHTQVADIFHKLKKECSEISIDQNDKIMVVLNRNIELALADKMAAAQKLTELERWLDMDHNINLVKKEMMVTRRRSLTFDLKQSEMVLTEKSDEAKEENKGNIIRPII